MGSGDPWEAARARVTTLLARRDAVLDETARAWAGFARAQGWTGGDIASLWEGLTEDLVRRIGHERGGQSPERVRREVLATMAALRDRIVAGLEQ